MNSPLRITDSPYKINGENASPYDFTAVACDPSRSVGITACAGSGKTWLLVSRMLRLLLSGAEPSELLAITFTRSAAQEMRDRLMSLLRELAVSSDENVRSLLMQRGIPASKVGAFVPFARGLYARVLSSTNPLSIDTFHSWFGKILKLAPLTSGVPHNYSLTESSGELMTEAYTRMMTSLSKEENNRVRSALISLYDSVGDSNAKLLLDAFVSKRAEWWAMTQDGNADSPLLALQELCAEDLLGDPRLAAWENEDLISKIHELADVLANGSKRNIERSTAILAAVCSQPSIENFKAIMAQFVDDKGEPKGNDHRRGAMKKAAETHYGEGKEEVFAEEFAAVGAHLALLHKRSFEVSVMAINEALFTAGTAYLDQYQSVKDEQSLFDFGDLEWHAYRVLMNETQASYLQARLDSRYKHILLDEFQDTNMMQWSLMLAWIDAYGDDSQKPSLFIVGDPKQSIYHFRRSDPRVFEAAMEKLKELGADILLTSQTRRNSTSIVNFLNESQAGNSLFVAQSTDSASRGGVWRLPLATDDDELKAMPDEVFSIRDPLTTPRDDREDVRRYNEGVIVSRALMKAKEEFGAKWSDVMLLVKKRKHLGAYESALRQFGIPFVSDRRGGLLESLEVSDMIALMRFLVTPRDDLSLAQVLKSPIFCATDDDLIMLAKTEGATWWERMLVKKDCGSPAISSAVVTLGRWLEVAPKLAVHDLVDIILSEGDLVQRYAIHAPAVLRSQIIGNIEAFVEMSLNLDAGRYPSLSRFIDTIVSLQNAESDAPSEADVDDATDAVRIMTIHGAKGLEAKIVVMLDSNHTENVRDDCGVLCEWNKDSRAPTHFSVYGKAAERGAARDPMFAAEAALMEQENWNQLYVGITRAKECFIASGVADKRKGCIEGVKSGSWYDRMLVAEEVEISDDIQGSKQTAIQTEEFSLTTFSPAKYPAPELI
jgi:ATP-dependent helicase/nuclease subunit A